MFLSCAEASADGHLAALAGALRSRRPGVRLVGVGGPAMAAAGVELLAETTAGARMGLGAFLRAREVRRWLRETDDFYRKTPTAVHVCCDSWTMNKHFAALARRRGARVVWYVAPQAWASRPGRAKALAGLADEVACVLPFAADWFRARGVNARFVGHPLMTGRGALPPAADAGPPRLALLCGSRKSVAAANARRMRAGLDVIRGRVPGVAFACPTTPATHEVVAGIFGGEPDVVIERGGFDALVPTCRAAWCVSGTATLHAALCGVPMVIVYAGSPLLWHGVGRWLITTRTFGLINLLAGGFEPSAQVCPEFVPWHGDATPAAEAVADLLTDAAARQRQRAAFARLIADLGGRDAAAAVAEMVLRKC